MGFHEAEAWFLDNADLLEEESADVFQKTPDPNAASDMDSEEGPLQVFEDERAPSLSDEDSEEMMAVFEENESEKGFDRSDPVASYLRDTLSSAPLLSRKEELELARSVVSARERFQLLALSDPGTAHDVMKQYEHI